MTVVRDLEIMSRAHRYNQWIYDTIAPYAGRRIIEVGAGIGNLTRLFLDRDLIVAVEAHPAMADRLRETFGQVPNVRIHEMDITTTEFLELASYEPDTIVCVNVLEHIEDDLSLLESMRDILVPGGKIVLFVPAFPFVMGTIDLAVGHHRRYTRRALAKTIEDAGLELRKCFYMNSIAPLGWFINNRILRKKAESPTQVLVFDRFVVPWLRIMESFAPPPFGLSIVAVCEKR